MVVIGKGILPKMAETFRLKIYNKLARICTGIIKLRILGGSKLMQICRVIWKDFPYNNALFGLVL